MIPRFREDAIVAIRGWEARGDRVDKARNAYEASLGQAAKKRYDRELEAYRVAKDYAISMLCRIGKRLRVNGVEYRSIPSRREIRVTVTKDLRRKS